MITATQAYALAILDRTPESNRQYVIDYLCNGLNALGTPKQETENLRGFLTSELQSMQTKSLTSSTA